MRKFLSTNYLKHLPSFKVDGKKVYTLDKHAKPPMGLLKKVYGNINDDRKIPVVFENKKQYLQEYIKNQEGLKRYLFPKQQQRAYINTELQDMNGVVSRYTTKHNKYIEPRIVFFTDAKLSPKQFALSALHEYGHELWEKNKALRRRWNSKISPTTSPTLYGHTDKEEDFSESYAIYKYNNIFNKNKNRIVTPIVNTDLKSRFNIIQDYTAKSKINFKNIKPLDRPFVDILQPRRELISKLNRERRLKKKINIDIPKDKESVSKRLPHFKEGTIIGPGVYSPTWNTPTVKHHYNYEPPQRNITIPDSMPIKEGQKVIINEDLIFSRKQGGLLTRKEYQEQPQEHTKEDFLYLEKGTKMKAAESGKLGDIEFYGGTKKVGEHETSLSPEWVSPEIDKSPNSWWSREKYHRDEKWREQQLERTKKWRGENTERVKEYAEKRKPELNEIRRERYKTDAVYREKILDDRRQQRKNENIIIPQDKDKRVYSFTDEDRLNAIRKASQKLHKKNFTINEYSKFVGERDKYPSASNINNYMGSFHEARMKAIESINAEEQLAEENKITERQTNLFEEPDDISKERYTKLLNLQNDYLHNKNSVPLKKAEMVTLWHGTQKKFLPSIQREGLGSEHGSEGFTYLTPSPLAAVSHAEHGPEKEIGTWVGAGKKIDNPEPVVLKVTIPTKKIPEYYRENVLNKKIFYEVPVRERIGTQFIKVENIQKIKQDAFKKSKYPEEVAEISVHTYTPIERKEPREEEPKVLQSLELPTKDENKKDMVWSLYADTGIPLADNPKRWNYHKENVFVNPSKAINVLRPGQTPKDWAAGMKFVSQANIDDSKKDLQYSKDNYPMQELKDVIQSKHTSVPPIVVDVIDKEPVLIDGRHRLAAAYELNSNVPITIIGKEKEDVIKLKNELDVEKESKIYKNTVRALNLQNPDKNRKFFGYEHKFIDPELLQAGNNEEEYPVVKGRKVFISKSTLEKYSPEEDVFVEPRAR